MKIFLRVGIIWLVLSMLAYGLTAQGNFYLQADSFFSKYVDSNGNVDYKALVNDPGEVNSLVKEIENYSVNSASAAEKKAFYTNAYNILVIKQIVDRYPIEGPLKVDGFFDKIKSKVAGEYLTLNQVEKDKNLFVNGDERLHFVLVCGAKGCPPLANFAYTPEKIESQLEDRTKLALNSSSFIRHTGNQAEISQIFSWYEGDFKGKVPGGIVGYLNKYRKNQIPLKAKIVYYEYNWNLNIQYKSK
ncbi:MAG: DUF547 domain-containing protein [Cyclobacteriaceae bacterium]